MYSRYGPFSKVLTASTMTVTPAASAFSGGEAHVLACQRELFFAVHAGDLVPHERVHSPASQRPREIEGHRHVLPELLLPIGISREPPVSGRHISGVEVEERRRQDLRP